MCMCVYVCFSYVWSLNSEVSLGFLSASHIETGLTLTLKLAVLASLLSQLALVGTCLPSHMLILQTAFLCALGTCNLDLTHYSMSFTH